MTVRETEENIEQIFPELSNLIDIINKWLSHGNIDPEPRQPGGCKLKTAPVRPVVAARPAEYVCSEDLFY